MKKTVYRVLLLLMILVVCTSCSSNKTIKAIDFPERASANNVDFSSTTFNISSQANEVLNDKFNEWLYIYPIKNQSFTLAQREEICKRFGLDASTCKKNSTELFVEYSFGSESLYFYHNGTLRYNNSEYDTTTLELSDKEAQQNVEDFLKAKNLLSDEFSFSGVGDCTLSVNHPNSTGSDTITYGKTVTFRRKINGFPVVGNSHIYATVTNTGIHEISIAYHLYGNKEKISVISPQTAVEIMKQPTANTQFVCDATTELIDEATINSIELVYVEHAYDTAQTHIQPCYRISGVLEDIYQKPWKFSSLVPAIPSELTSR